MRKLETHELHFLIHRALQQLPQSVLRDLAGAADRRQRGLQLAADIFAARFAGHEIYAPDPMDGPSRHIGR